MKRVDRFLQNWRYSEAEPFVPHGCDILDIGGFDGSFLYRVYDRIRSGICLDPLAEPTSDPRIDFISSSTTTRLPFSNDSFDVVTLIAVLEHLGGHREAVASEIQRVCRSRGRVIITVPSKFVDPILRILVFFGLIDGMSLDQHEHYAPKETVSLFERHGFSLCTQTTFQLGFNNLFVFQKK